MKEGSSLGDLLSNLRDIQYIVNQRIEDLSYFVLISPLLLIKVCFNT